MADVADEDAPLLAQAPVEEAAEEAPAPAAEAPAPAAEAPAPAEEKPAEEEKPEEKVKEEVAKSPKKSPAKAKKEEPAADEPTVKKGRAKKEKKADAEDNEDEEDPNAGQYWEGVQEGQKRQRKSLEHFKVEVPKVKELAIQKGAGKALKDIPAIVESFANYKFTKDDPKEPLKELSRLLFNKFANFREIKANILDFNGFVFANDKAEENMKARIKKVRQQELKGIMKCLALESNGNQSDLVDRLLDFLKKPDSTACTGRGFTEKTSKKAKSSSKKRSANGSQKKTPAKKAAKKSKKEEEESEEDEDEEEEKVESPKKKAKAAPKKKAAADDDDDSDMDAPLSGKYLDKLKAHVKTVISEQDMDSLTLRKVRDILAEKYQVDIEKYKSKIREFVDDEVAAAQ